MTRILSFLLLLILSATTSVAQRCRVFGVVRDQDGAPIELANVRIPGTAIGTSCDLQGRYSLTFESRDSGTGERNGANGRRDNCHQPVHRFPFITWVNPSTTHYLSPHGAKRRIVYQNLAHKGAGKFDIISEYG